MPLIRSANHALLRVLMRPWRRDRIDHYIRHLAIDPEEPPGPNIVRSTFQTIDGKASGLLTHTSMMIAALGVSARVVANDYFEQGVIVGEIMLYLLVALGCLRCLSVFDAYSGEPLKDAVGEELILRRELYRLCNRAAILLTLIVLISLPLLYLYVPKKGA
jgi:uncharacterized membrane protein